MAQDVIEQAIYTSRVSRNVRGYHLVARSPGINDELARDLCQWSPSHGGLLDKDRDATGWSFFRVSQGRLAIGRTVYGLPEYSGRGGYQVFTSYLVIPADLPDRFDGNITRFCRLARSEGWLQWTPRIPSNLPALRIPAPWALRVPPNRVHGLQSLVRRVREHLSTGANVAVIDRDEPWETLQVILGDMPREERKEISFGVGLKPAAERPFRLQVFPFIDFETRDALHRNQVTLLRDERVAEALLSR